MDVSGNNVCNSLIRQVVSETMKTKNHRSQQYQHFVRSKVCLVCGGDQELQAHHCRLLGSKGTGLKPPDTYCVPLCFKCHLKLHSGGERNFWIIHNIDVARKIIELQTEYISLIEKEEINDGHQNGEVF